jgi:hypothetical protein
MLGLWLHKGEIATHDRTGYDGTCTDQVAFQHRTLSGELLYGTRTLKSRNTQDRPMYPPGTPIVVFFNTALHFSLV